MQQQHTRLQLIEPIRVPSRDGLTLLCYLCLPQLADGETAALVVTNCTAAVVCTALLLLMLYGCVVGTSGGSYTTQ